MMSEPVTGYIHSTESFGSVDGPGIRFVTFMQGCRMRCEFCHNPDTWNIGGGHPITSQELLDQALQYRAFWGRKGGVTVSGGEPLLQIDFLIDFFKRCKKAGVHTTLDSCGMPFTYDEPFFSLTGWTNKNILQLAEYLSDKGQPVWIRHVLVPERSDYDEYLIRLSEFVSKLKNVLKFEILPYHKLGVYKWKNLGIPYKLDHIEPPTQERVDNARRILRTDEYKGYLNA